jgi:hypothetical protein
MAVKRESCRRNRRAPSTVVCDRSAPVRARWESCEPRPRRTPYLLRSTHQRVQADRQTGRANLDGFAGKDAGVEGGSALTSEPTDSHIDLCTLARMHRCRPLPDLTPEHIRVIRHTLTRGLDEPICNSYIASADEFPLLEEMVQMGLKKYQRSVLRYQCYGVTGRGAARVGLYVPTRDQILRPRGHTISERPSSPH